MLKRFSSLILVLMLGGSVLAAPALQLDEHGCEMAGMEMTPGMETTPCCKEHESPFILSESRSSEQCCFTTPQETGSQGATFNLSARSFSIAVTHPAVGQSPLPLLGPYQSSYSQVLPDLQHCYIRNLSLLI